MKLSILFLSLVVGACPGQVAAQSADIDHILEQLIAAYGGEKNLQLLDSMEQEWDIVARSSGRAGKDGRKISAPSRLLVDLDYGDRREQRILVGDRGYVKFGSQELRESSVPQRDAMRLQLMRLYSPLTLKKKKAALTLTLEENLCVLSLLEHGVRTDYLVNRSEWRIEKVAGLLDVNGMQMHFMTEYSDFHFRDGVLLHGAENKYAGEVNTATLKLSHVELGARLADTDFLPPEPLFRSIRN